MFSLSGYNITEKIFESPVSLVYQGHRTEDNIPVILKVLKQDYPSREELVRYRQEFEITHKLDLKGVIRAYAQEKYGNSLVIVLEDFGGLSLKTLQQKQKFSISKVIDLGIRITQTLGKIHAVDVIHKDINPSNLVYNPDQDDIKIIDFGISTKLSKEIPEIRNPENLEGTLAYMSPEQTGRMNRALDYRSDYYALGATLYELLTGSPPFQSDDPMELVHSHLAKEPEIPHELNPLISENLSRVLLKLLAKRAEDRYQSARGIMADLKFCLEEAQNGPKTLDFVPGKADASNRFTLPQKLYGREEELELLLAASERASKGPGEALFIAGYSGVGKSALVGELYKPIAARRGYFISGKFDQYRRNIPYSALVSAFQDLLRQLMTESQLRIASWKEKLQQALGPNGQILTEFLPELEIIIGEQTPVPELDATAARNRFNLVLQNFVRVFCEAEHPLVIFLDDLQWVDPASLQFMELLMKGTHHFFLIGAYRNNEVDSHHPLLTTMDEISKLGASQNNIELLPLEEKDVRRYIADLTRTDDLMTEHLAKLVKDKTRGNPFFMGELLKSLFRENVLEFEPQSGSWSYDPVRLQEQDISQNVVEFMSRRISELEPATQSVLSQAACIGNVFDLGTLSLIYEKSITDTAADLWPALSGNLVLPLKLEYKLAALQDSELSREEQITYKFAHDRIQEASYSVIPEAELTTVHLKVGRLILSAANKEERERNIFKIVDHLNVGAALMEEQSERDKLAELNLTAGKRAQSSNAYQPALRYFRKGLELLGDNAWNRQYELCLELASLGAEAGFLGHNNEEMEELIAEVLNKARALQDMIRIYEIRLMSNVTSNDFQAAIKTARDVLRKLKVKLPEKPRTRHIMTALMGVKVALMGKSFKSLLNKPPMENPNARAASRILSALIPVAYLSAPALFPLIVTNMIRLSLKYGNSDESPFAYSAYGILLCGVLGDLKKGALMGQLAMELIEKLKLEKVRARVSHIQYGAISHWSSPVHNSCLQLRKNIQTGLENGDLEYFGYSTMLYCSSALQTGQELEALEEETSQDASKLSELEITTSLQYLNIYRQSIQSLRSNEKQSKESIFSDVLTGTFYNEIEMLPRHEETQDQNAIFFVFFYKLMLSCLFQEHSNGLIYAEKTRQLLGVVPGLSLVVLHYFYDSLVHLAVYPKSDKREQKRIRKRVKANQKKIANWAKHAPMNNNHRYALVAAEEARVLGRPDEARKQYEIATKRAKENDFPNDEALAWELAGRFYLEQKSDEFADLCLKNAHYGYKRWGATAKVIWMELRYPRLGSSEAADADKKTSSKSTLQSESSIRSDASQLDLASIIKASSAIAEEKHSAGLMQKLMQVVLENTGAGEGYLIIEKKDTYFGEAHARVENEEVELLKSAPLESLEDLPQKLITYVIRTKEAMVLDEASENDLFREDPAIRRRRPRSVLCSPILHQERVTGLIYLENNLASGVFTPNRLEVLQLLSAQIAVSLKNTLDYEELLKANKIKGQFMGKMSHELRTPLNNILGLTSEQLEDENASEKQKEAARSVKESGERLAFFVENLLDVSGTSPKARRDEEFSLSQFMASLVFVFQKRADTKSLSFIWSPSALPETVHGDKNRLEQILNNLLDNAVKYTQEGQINFRAAYESGTLICEIKDSGPGLSPEQEKRIFSPFQGDEEGAQAAEGSGMTGMGLSVSKMLAEEMGGVLKLDSKPGNGCLFTLNIPLESTGETKAPTGNDKKQEQTVSITPPPPESLEELHELAKSGDIAEILLYTERLEKSGPEYAEFARELRRLAQGFQERKIRELIEKYI